jgi:hypothetical protein
MCFIGDTLARYIDRSEQKEVNFSCPCIHVEVDVQNSLSKYIQLSLDKWKHIYVIYYEKIPFKCNFCSEKNHFAKEYKEKTQSNQPSQEKEEQWEQVIRKNQMRRKIFLLQSPR